MLDWTFSPFHLRFNSHFFFYWNVDTEVKISAAPVDLNSNVLSQFESISIKWIEWSSFPLLTRIQFDSIPVSFNEASIDQWSKWFQIEDCPNSSRIPIQVESQFNEEFQSHGLASCFSIVNSNPTWSDFGQLQWSINWPMIWRISHRGVWNMKC